MSKKLLYLLGILLTIIVGTILHWYFFCDCSVRLGHQEAALTGKSIITQPDEKITDLKTTSSDSVVLMKWNAVKENLNVRPLILYFKINQAEMSLNQEEESKMKEIIEYLSNVPDAGLLVSGHTDNSGNHDENVRLGQERAHFVRNYLARNGISESKVTCTSKGPDEPIADNNTSAGRAKNRRAIILIK